MRIEHYTPDEWKVFAENAHLLCFDEHRPIDMDRIHFALLAIEDDKPRAYVTVRELDSESVYWNYGGALPGTRDTIYSFKAYLEFVEWHRGKYERVTTLIKNTNTPMLKMAMKVGFKIIGLRCFQNEIYLEHFLELGG